MKVDLIKANKVNIYMPVWAPGSYLIREFEKSVEQLSAIDERGNSISFGKIRKNCWQFNSEKSKSITIKYKVYAFELSPRTSFIDQEHAYLSGSSIFMTVEGLESNPLLVRIKPFNSWKTCSVALPKLNDTPWNYTAENYDELVDSPFEIGNHQVFSFISSGVKHDVAFFGTNNADTSILKKDMITVTTECAKVFGSHPCKYYLFIIQNVPSGGGGLEHKNSCTIQTNRWGYTNEKTYRGLVTLITHEYFHLWNVKRLRPNGLGPFNYNEENHTDLLYIAEGFTSYYEDLLTCRAGIISDRQFLDELAGNISYLENTPGNKFLSVASSSYDAWIKYYRSNENSNNSSISYYTKGTVVGAMLDLKIRSVTNGKFSLDDLMKGMYQKFAVDLNRGYSGDDFIQEVNQLTGKDFNEFFSKYIYSTDSIPYNEYFKSAGLTLTTNPKDLTTPWIGMNTSNSSGKLTVTSIDRNSPAWNDGINVNDEIIAINNVRITDDFQKQLNILNSPGETIEILLSRAGLIKTISVKSTASPLLTFTLSKSPDRSEMESSNYFKWLNIK
jgi:predicted metalloprotease with PDZ domain